MMDDDLAGIDFDAIEAQALGAAPAHSSFTYRPPCQQQQEQWHAAGQGHGQQQAPSCSGSGVPQQAGEGWGSEPARKRLRETPAPPPGGALPEAVGVGPQGAPPPVSSNRPFAAFALHANGAAGPPGSSAPTSPSARQLPHTFQQGPLPQGQQQGPPRRQLPPSFVGGSPRGSTSAHSAPEAGGEGGRYGRIHLGSNNAGSSSGAAARSAPAPGPGGGQQGPQGAACGQGPQQQGPGPPQRLAVNVTVTLADADALHFRFAQNAPAARAALDRIPGGRWERAGGCQVWRCPLGEREAALGALRSAPRLHATVAPPRGLDDVPLSILEAARALPDDSGRYGRLPGGLEQKLLPFQREGVRFALRRGGRALIGDEMGLGKTVQAIALLAAYQDEWPALIVAPASLREQWADALQQWLGLGEDEIHTVRDKGSQTLSGAHAAYIVGTTSVHKLQEALGMLAPEVIILDESHKIKSRKAQCTRALLPLLQAARRAILLTGTAALARPIELRPQLEALLPPRLGAAASRGGSRSGGSSQSGRVPKTLPGLTERAYGERYCKSAHAHNPHRPHYANPYDGATNLEELNRVLTGSVMVRRLKRDVLAQLPPKRRQQVYLQPADAERTALRKLTDRNSQALSAAAQGRDKAEERRLGVQWFNECAPLKAKAVQAYVEELLERDQKFLIFAHHACMLDAIEFTCNQYKAKSKARWSHIRIDGKVAAEKRHDLVRGFQQQDNLRAAILSTTAAGTGLTLTNASVVVFAEYSWTPGDLLQAEDRAHRIGQAAAVNVYYLHLKGSVDDVMWRTIRTKLENVGQVLNGRGDRLDVASAPSHAGGSKGGLARYLQPVGGQKHPDAPHPDAPLGPASSSGLPLQGGPPSAVPGAAPGAPCSSGAPRGQQQPPQRTADHDPRPGGAGHDRQAPQEGGRAGVLVLSDSEEDG